MTFNYESSIWGRGTASLFPGDPTSIRLRAALAALAPLHKGDNVLEVGCGAGQFIRAIKKLRPDLVCHGSDISRKALEIARRSLDGVLYSEQNGSSVPYSDRSISAVVIFDVLEHVDDPVAFMREVNRVLKPGGTLYAFVPCEGDILSIWHLLKFLIPAWAGKGWVGNLTKRFAGHIQYYSRNSLVELVEKSGFEIRSLNYSEHILGQLLGLAAFFSMSHASGKLGGGQINNESYFTQNSGSGLTRRFKRFVNGLIYVESYLLQHVPSPNKHLVAKKK